MVAYGTAIYYLQYKYLSSHEYGIVSAGLVLVVAGTSLIATGCKSKTSKKISGLLFCAVGLILYIIACPERFNTESFDTVLQGNWKEAIAGIALALLPLFANALRTLAKKNVEGISQNDI